MFHGIELNQQVATLSGDPTRFSAQPSCACRNEPLTPVGNPYSFILKNAISKPDRVRAASDLETEPQILQKPR